MPEKLEEKPTSIKLWPGMKREISRYAKANGIPFQAAVRVILDFGLHHVHYKFPSFKPESTINLAEDEDENGN